MKPLLHQLGKLAAVCTHQPWLMEPLLQLS